MSAWGASDLPDGWAWSTLGDLADVQLGKMLDAKRQTGKTAMRYLRNINVQWHQVGLDDLLQMDVAPEERERYTVRTGDLLVCEGGEPGRCAIVPESASGLAYQKALHRVRPRGDVQASYLGYLIEFLATTGLLSSYFTGSTIKHLPREKAISLPVPVPPVEEQRRIVAKLEEHLSLVDSTATALIALLHRISGLRDAARNHVVERALTATARGTRAAGDVATVQGGLQKQPERHVDGSAGLPFLRVANVGRGSLDLTEVHRILVRPSELPRALLERGDLLVVEGNGSPDQIGRAALWDGSIEPCTHQNHLIRVRPAEVLLPEYLELVWNAPTTVAQLKLVASSTSGLYTLSTSKVKAVRIPVPGAEVQRVLVHEASAILAKASAAGSALSGLQRKVSAIRRSFLSAAFTGRLADQDPADVPVDVLLEQIAEVRVARGSVTRGRRRNPGATRRPEEAVLVEEPA